MTDLLSGDLRVEPQQSEKREDFNAIVLLVNEGAEGLVVNLAPLASASLALELTDASGSPARLPPPPVPGGPANKRTLQSGEELKLDFPGFVPQWFEPGTYRARLRYIHQPQEVESNEWTGTLSSEWVDFTIL